MTAEPPTGYRPSLDGVRAVAIALVMAEHAKLHLFHAGGIGVDVFFVLSGYLITGLLTAEVERDGRLGFKAFYARRATRLYPALLLLVVVGGLVLWHEGAPARRMVEAGAIAISYLTDLFSFGHATVWALWGFTWSLSIEEHFYLLWPPVLYLLLRRGGRTSAVRVAWAGAAAGAVAVVALAVNGTFGPPPLYFQPQAHAGGLLLGCALALAPRLPSWSKHLAGPSLVGLLLLVLLSPSPVHATYFRLLPLAWVLTGALIAGLSAPSRTTSMLAWEPVRLVGVVSYGLYLYHQLVFHEVARHLHTNRPTLVAVEVALTFVVAGISYRWVEAPIRARGRVLAGRLSPQVESAAGA